MSLAPDADDGLAGAAAAPEIAASTEVIVTFFEDWVARTKTEERLSLGELAERIRATTAPAKDALPWLKFARFGTLSSKGGSLRWNGNVRDLSGVVGEYDGEKMSIDEAVERLDKAGVTAFVYSSPSHMWDGHGPRWRVCCPFSAPLPPEQHYQMMSRLNGVLGGVLASESWTLSQAYYYGAVENRPATQIEIVDGTATLDRCEELDETAIGKPNGSANGHDRAGNPEAPIGDIVAALEVIPNDNLDWTQWNTIGMAAWCASGGAEDAFAAFDRWSQKSPKYDAAESRFRWDHYETSPPSQVGFGTLVFRARQAQPGWTPPSRKKTTADPDYIRQKLLLADWLTRDIAAPDYLLGDLLSTTSRVLLVGPTGLGKTNLGLAIAYAIAAGDPFLNLRASEGPRRVLYIDGEMPERLMRARLEDALRRLGTQPDGLFVLSREDFPDMPPVNTEAGQKFIDCVIDILDRVDLVIFDNIQALLTGDMKEEESWQQTLPWVRELTRRKIGQIWVHHTGHDETHSYGTKTREWQLDTVILLERVERPEADIAFLMKFPKARERTPDNRCDFEPTVITLADDTWTSERSGHVRTSKRTAPERVLELLQDAIAREGVIPPANEHIPPNTHCVTEGLWRRYCEKGCISEGSPDPAKKAEADRKAFKRATAKLIGQKVGKWDLWVWIV